MLFLLFFLFFSRLLCFFSPQSSLFYRGLHSIVEMKAAVFYLDTAVLVLEYFEHDQFKVLVFLFLV